MGRGIRSKKYNGVCDAFGTDEWIWGWGWGQQMIHCKATI